MQDIIVFLLGLIFGSFIAAYSYRYPLGISVSEGFSFCDKCGKKIGWFENIPLFSYLFLRGRCLRCSKKISTRYPVIELVSGLSFLLIYWTVGPNLLDMLVGFGLYCILALIFVIDFENQIIPDYFVFAGIFVVLSLTLITNNNQIFGNLFAGFLGSSFLLLLYLFTSGRGMGLGDVKFAVLGGLIVGVDSLFTWFLVSFLTGAITGIILILLGNAKMKDKIAFGPFLILAIPISLFFNDQIMKLIGYSP